MLVWTKAKVLAAAVVVALVVCGLGTGIIAELMAGSSSARSAANGDMANGDRSRTDASTGDAPAGDRPADSATLAARFPDGVSVELVGLAPSPIDNQLWWRGDGSAMVNPPDQIEGARVYSQANERGFSISARLTGLPEDAATTWEISGSNGYAEVSSRKDGVRHVLAAFSIPADRETATLRLRIAAGEWTTRADSTTTTAQVVSFSEPRAEADGLKVTLTHAPLFSPSRVEDHRVVAALMRGGVVASTERTSQSQGVLTQITYTFPDIAPQDVARIEFQTRPYDRWAEFRDVSLRRGQRTRPSAATSP